MSKIICIMGESGAGKTTSLRKLPPAETFFVDADGKGLPWKGWRQQYCKENKNYLKSNVQETIIKAFLKIKGDNLPFKFIVVDTINAVMVGDESRRRAEKGYDKWADLTWAVWDIVEYANDMPEDITVILVAHSETIVDDDGEKFTRIKTSGRKLSKMVLESRINTVLLAKHDGAGYKFYPHAPNSTAKCPMGAIDEDCIDNDIMYVVNALKDF